MSFDAPWAFALLAALPVIVALWLLRPRRPRIRIPSVMLWPGSQAERQSARPWQRLKNHPLLWLQLLIALLLALAAAQPFIPADTSEQRVIVLLDASGSMRAHDVLPTRWDQAVAATVDLARKLGPDQTLSVIRADDQPRVLVADTRAADRVEAVLRAEQPSFAPIDPQTTLSLAAGLAQGHPSEWILVGDGRFPSDDSTTIPPDTRVEFVGVGNDHAGNVALTHLTLRPTGSTFALQVGITNASDLNATGSVQLLDDGGVIVATSTWSAAPHADVYITWDGVLAGPRWFEARFAALDPPQANNLDTDDRAFVVALGRGASGAEQRALLVTGGNTFLERALAVAGNLRTFKVPPTDLPTLVSQEDAATYALVVLDRQSPDATPLTHASTLWVGGGTGDAFQPRLVAPVPDHPLARNVDWSDVRIGRARHVPDDPAHPWETVVDSDGGPLLVVRTVRDDTTGSGSASRPRREALLTFELGESDLPLRPAFPVLMANLLDWLTPRPETNLQPVTPGSASQVDTSPLATSLRAESALDGQVPPDALAPPWPARAFRPPSPGVYRLIADTPDGPSTSYLVAEAYAPSEADLTRVTPALVHDSPSQLASALNSVRAGIWPWLLAALMLAAAAEWFVDARGR